MSEIVHIENLEKTYVSTGETLTVLKALDLSVEEGSKVVITGESGCGKSTLLNIIGGIDSATSGIVRSGGRDITSLDENAQADYRSHFLGFVFQFHYLLKDFTALENVYLPAYMAGVSKKDAISRAERLLEDVGLQDRLHHLPSELSGGERQRAAVARALINDPHLILADEPTGNLDPVNAEIVGSLLFSIADKYRKTLIMVTHDQNLAAKGSVRYSIAGGKLEAAD
ncbi:ABC transporter ATP-binding protein [Treponema socranskii]|uniref:ABC transporter ATP-binding protein n=1 Tax=Treponema socranskii TaxID=53419 RepID=UPI003D902348